MSQITTSNETGLSAEQVGTFKRDGFVIASGLYDAEEMLRWKQAIQDFLGDEVEAVSDTGVRVWMVEVFPPALIDSMRDEKVTPILKQLIGPSVEFLSAKAVFKNAATSFPSPWHQDWYYWKGPSKLSVWIALDDATPENGCLKFIPGTHKKQMPNRLWEGARFGNRIDDEHLEGLPVQTVSCKRGDAVFFHDLAVHSSHPNVNGQDRWSMISTYRDASVKDDSAVWKSSMVLCGESVNDNARK